jgi:hypothetical protein
MVNRPDIIFNTKLQSKDIEYIYVILNEAQLR